MKFIIGTICLGISVGMFVLFIKPTYDATAENRQRIANFDEALAKTREIQELKKSLLARRNQFSDENIARLQKMLPDHVDNVRLVLDLDGIAEQYGMLIQNVGVQTIKEDGEDTGILDGSALQNRPYQSLTLTFQVRSSYEEFMLFLQDLESSLRIVDIAKLSVTESGANPGLYNFDVALRTYWLP